jgi:hypothetical protein
VELEVVNLLMKIRKLAKNVQVTWRGREMNIRGIQTFTPILNLLSG